MVLVKRSKTWANPDDAVTATGGSTQSESTDVKLEQEVQEKRIKQVSYPLVHDLKVLLISKDED